MIGRIHKFAEMSKLLILDRGRIPSLSQFCIFFRNPTKRKELLTNICLKKITYDLNDYSKLFELKLSDA